MSEQLSKIAKKNLDGTVSIYNDDGSVMCKFRNFDSNKPTYRNKYVNLNCYKFVLDWVH